MPYLFVGERQVPCVDPRCLTALCMRSSELGQVGVGPDWAANGDDRGEGVLPALVGVVIYEKNNVQ